MIIDDDDYDDDELEDMGDIGGEYDLLFNDNIVDKENQGNHFGDYQHENQKKNYMERDRAVHDNNSCIPCNHRFSENSLDS